MSGGGLSQEERARLARDLADVRRRNTRFLYMAALVAGGILSLGALTSCATDPGTYDLRPAMEAGRAQAARDYLDCEGVSDQVCTCRQEGLEKEYGTPSRMHFDQGYAALERFTSDPANADATREAAERHAVEAIYAAIAEDVAGVCTYFDEGGDAA